MIGSHTLFCRLTRAAYKMYWQASLSSAELLAPSAATLTLPLGAKPGLSERALRLVQVPLSLIFCFCPGLTRELFPSSKDKRLARGSRFRH